MTKVYTSAVVIIPPKDLWDTIQEIREKFDRNFHRWMPHITLLYPFRPKLEYNSLESQFNKTCNHLKPFNVILKNFHYFHHRKHNFTIWLEPEPIDLIISLQKKLQVIVPDCNDVNKHKGGYTPHLSLGQIYGEELLFTILQKLNSEWKALQFKVDKIYFISRGRNKASQFRVKKLVSLSDL